MGNPIGTYTIGEVIADIRVYLRAAMGDKYIEKNFPKKFIFREINRALPELQEYGGIKDSTEQSDYYETVVTTDAVNLTSYANYKYIDKITHITWEDDRSDGVNRGLCIEVSEKEFENIKYNINNSNYIDSIIYYRKGDMLYFAKGSGCSNYGTRRIYHTRIPQKATALSTLLDIKDTGLNKLIARVVKNLTGVSLTIGADTIQAVGAAKNSEIEEKIKHQIKS